MDDAKRLLCKLRGQRQRVALVTRRVDVVDQFLGSGDAAAAPRAGSKGRVSFLDAPHPAPREFLQLLVSISVADADIHSTV